MIRTIFPCALIPFHITATSLILYASLCIVFVYIQMKRLVSSLLLRLIPFENTRRESTIKVYVMGGSRLGKIANILREHISSVRRHSCLVTGGSNDDEIPYLLLAKDANTYETHIVISTSEPRLGMCKKFTTNVLQCIKYHGYNVIQLMSIIQHAYYACTPFSCCIHSRLSIDAFLSFRYKVTSFFCDKLMVWNSGNAEGVVRYSAWHGADQSPRRCSFHVCKNVLDGRSEFNGTDHRYFHEGDKRRHKPWDSHLFNYGMLQFLTSDSTWINISSTDSCLIV